MMKNQYSEHEISFPILGMQQTPVLCMHENLKDNELLKTRFTQLQKKNAVTTTRSQDSMLEYTVEILENFIDA